MIFMMYGESNLCTIAFTFYTCICIPFLQVFNSVFRIVAFLLNPHDQSASVHSEEIPVGLDLPVLSFQDLGENRGDGDGEICSICLMEFRKADLVNKLPRCGHVFHMECIEKWLDRCQFTCPLCRSLMLHDVRLSPCKEWCSGLSTRRHLDNHS